MNKLDSIDFISECPYCKHPFELYTNAFGKTDTARNGDVSFCIKCGQVGIFMNEKIIKTEEVKLNTFQLLAVDKLRQTWIKIKEDEKNG